MKPLPALVTGWLISILIAAPLAAQPSPRAPTSMPGLNYDAEFFPGAHYDASIPTPDETLGFPVGSKPASHAQIESVIKAVAAKSPRTKLFEYAKTHEGRTLYYLVISSEANIKRLDALKTDLASFADPRRVSKSDADRLADTLPAVAWMAYVIHGDEMSGSDAALAVAHHLAACTDAAVTKMLDELVIIIDPLMNPDGRDRFIAGMGQTRTAQPSVDDQSLMHTGVWPEGRGNHFYFDMNRDWIFGTQPETRGRIAAAGAWHPHYFVESHEMGSQSTFLFMPPREPVNPNIGPAVRKWAEVFGRDQGAAFDQRGWRYYSGEWNEEWYPGYSGSWSALRGAIDNLYEQAGIGTDAVRHPDGTLESYRESVHHQLVSTMANLTTLQTHRKEILKDYLAERRRNVAADGPNANRVFAVPPSANKGRIARLTDLLALQGIEWQVAGSELTVAARDRLGREFTHRTFPAGTLLIPVRQPEGPLLAATMDFDPHLATAFLNEERRELLRFGRSRLYDVTAWSLTMLFDVDAFEIETPVTLPREHAPIDQPPPQPLIGESDSTVGFAIDGTDDRSVMVAARLMERGIHVRVAEKPCLFDEREYPRGSLLITHKDNINFAGKLTETVSAVASDLGLQAIGLKSARGLGETAPDLGGEYFHLLETPRVAVVGREPIRTTGFGETWHLIDHVLGLRASYLDAAQLGGVGLHGRTAGGFDLRRYNVLIIPEGGGGFVRDRMDALKAWVETGGTLIAIRNSAAAIANKSKGIGSVQLLPDVLADLDDHRQAIVREWEARTYNVDPTAVWSATPPAQLAYPWLIGESGDKPKEDELKRRDAWRSMFMPQGAILAGRVDDRSWLTAGCGEYVPILFGGDTILITTGGASAPVRLGVFVPSADKGASSKPSTSQAATATTASADNKSPTTSQASDKGPPRTGWTLAPPGYDLRLRMSGLLWPEAADRLAHAAFVTRERVGNGQVILFASSPTFRAAALGTTRILTNAIVYGPGLGAETPIQP